MQDVMSALINLLAADGDVSDLVSTRIYGGQLPAAQAAQEPSKAIVLRFSGGAGTPGSADYIQAADQRIDVWCYGETAIEADKVRRAAHDYIKYIQRAKHGTTLIYRAIWVSGPIQMTDPECLWPMVVETYMVLAAEIAA
jgi:hypothetical protein